MTVSVIIPALNEEQFVLGAIRSALADGADEVIVVDGGSDDETARIAGAEARVVTGSRGRARQMNHGARIAGGEVLLFLHADSRLPSGSIPAAIDAVNQGFQSGCFRLRFEPTSPILNIYSSCTRLPFKSLCFGDRGLFVEKQLYELAGGFADIPAFEDLDIVKRLARAGSFVRLEQHIITSSRRFSQHGALRQQALNIALWTGYHIGVEPARLAKYYRYSANHRSV